MHYIYCVSFSNFLEIYSIFLKDGEIMIDYTGLNVELAKRGLNKKWLHDQLKISYGTIAKFGKGESVQLSTIEKICTSLNCNICDIVSIVNIQ